MLEWVSPRQCIPKLNQNPIKLLVIYVGDKPGLVFPTSFDKLPAKLCSYSRMSCKYMYTSIQERGVKGRSTSQCAYKCHACFIKLRNAREIRFSISQYKCTVQTRIKDVNNWHPFAIHCNPWRLWYERPESYDIAQKGPNQRHELFRVV